MAAAWLAVVLGAGAPMEAATALAQQRAPVRANPGSRLVRPVASWGWGPACGGGSHTCGARPAALRRAQGLPGCWGGGVRRHGRLKPELGPDQRRHHSGQACWEQQQQRGPLWTRYPRASCRQGCPFHWRCGRRGSRWLGFRGRHGSAPGRRPGCAGGTRPLRNGTDRSCGGRQRHLCPRRLP